jgi:hypothetical protein
MHFRCYYCKNTYLSFDENINHVSTHHPDQEIKFYALVVDPNSGKRHYRARSFAVVPNEAKKQGKVIKILPNSKISVEDETPGNNQKSEPQKIHCSAAVSVKDTTSEEDQTYQPDNTTCSTHDAVHHLEQLLPLAECQNTAVLAQSF